MKAVAISMAVVAVAGTIIAGYWFKVEKERAKEDIAKECIDRGGTYRTSFFLGRPRCRLPKTVR